jgi:predicted MarR family transcription regulator
MALLEALASHTYVVSNIGNRALRPVVAQLLGMTPESYSSAQITYDLRRLRLKGLIERIGKSHRYRLTTLGIKVVTFFTKLYQRIFCPGLAAMALEQSVPPKLAQALDTVVEIIRSSMENTFLVPVTDVA